MHALTSKLRHRRVTVQLNTKTDKTVKNVLCHFGLEHALASRHDFD